MKPGRRNRRTPRPASNLARVKAAMPVWHRRCLACGQRPAEPARLGYCADCWAAPP